MMGATFEYGWLALAVTLLAAAGFAFGCRGMLAALGLIAGFFLYRRGGDAERARQARQDARDAQAVADARAEAKGQSDADLNKELDRWTREE